ncbi:MAG: phosphatase PAP2 family protein [Armatimonadetes bacterium]|nr:phosphatase PAP2 family protein [Armatimonadota bacterium]
MILTTSTGLGQVQALGLLVAYWRLPQWRRHVLLIGLGGIVAGIVRLPMMRALGRMRPSNFDFARPMESVFGNSSFPSGHTTTTFAIVAMVALLIPSEYRLLKAGLVLWACLVGFSRIYLGVHYPLDVLGGMGLGVGISGVTYLVADRMGWLPEDHRQIENARTDAV